MIEAAVVVSTHLPLILSVTARSVDPATALVRVIEDPSRLNETKLAPVLSVILTTPLAPKVAVTACPPICNVVVLFVPFKRSVAAIKLTIPFVLSSPPTIPVYLSTARSCVPTDCC